MNAKVTVKYNLNATIMNVEQTEEFLKDGGILLKYSYSESNGHVIEKKTLNTDWHIHLVIESEQMGLDLINLLVKNHPDKFQKGNSK